ncbi:E3 ubiquitin protein ligase DRIP2-like [Cicer arietinum]|uniref:E3 ubiquitin protein ligase DRIP2-like n=1 Tax=Cicer arietinum TaxID=3827 RepID=UPI003CC6C19E
MPKSMSLITVCRECIEKKLTDEKLNHCPVCNVDLGCSPLDKLRTDNNLQGMRDKFFSNKGKNVKKTVSTKKKKKSQFSTKTNGKKAKRASKKVKNDATEKEAQEETKQMQEFSITPQEPKVSASEMVADVKKEERKHCGIEILDEVSTILSARRAKAVARKKFIRTDLIPTVDEKKDDKLPQFETFSETPKIRFKMSSKPESSQRIVLKNVSEDNAELRKGKAVMYDEPFNYLVETKSKNKSPNNSTMQENGVIPMLLDSSDNDSHHVPKVQVKKHWNHQIEPLWDLNESVSPNKDPLKFKLKLLDRNQEKRLKFIEDLNLPAQPESENHKETGPIWFSLVASKEREVGATLPQIYPSYLRVKNGNLSVSYIKKYLVMKLGLFSEAEVEILLEGKPVLSSMQLQNLVEFWLETIPKNGKIHTSVGSSAKDYIMVLSYGRKA